MGSPVRKIKIVRRGNPSEYLGFCSLCKRTADGMRGLDGVMLTDADDPEQNYHFFCLACAQAIGKAAR